MRINRFPPVAFSKDSRPSSRQPLEREKEQDERERDGQTEKQRERERESEYYTFGV